MSVPSRQSPSPRYHELLALYQRLHIEGDRQNQTPPEKTFSGKSLGLQAFRLREIVARHQAKTLLDYGCGKAVYYRMKPLKADNGLEFPSLAHYLGVAEENITLYDPAYAPYSRRPEGSFDAVVCTDVLEHCPEQDIPWILGDLFAYAERFVFANIACFPAKKTLPNGENAHCTIRPPEWWNERIAAAATPGVHYYFWVVHLVPGPDGKQLMKESLLASDLAM